MTRIIWSEPAIEQFAQIQSAKWRRHVYLGIQGLARFPRQGRVSPETHRYPELNRPFVLRDLVFPKLVRVFYRYDERADVVHVLALSFRGQEISPAFMKTLLQGS